MGLFFRNKDRSRVKKLKPGIYEVKKGSKLNIDKLATREDMAKLAEELKQTKIRLALTMLSPRQRVKLERMIAERKGKQDAKYKQ